MHGRSFLPATIPLESADHSNRSDFADAVPASAETNCISRRHFVAHSAVLAPVDRGLPAVVFAGGACACRGRTARGRTRGRTCWRRDDHRAAAHPRARDDALADGGAYALAGV